MDWSETVIPVGKGDEGFDVSPDGRELWTANAQDGTLSVIDLDTRKVTATLDAGTFGANRLKFTPDGKLVLISRLGDGDLVIYDAASRKEFKRVHIGHGAAGVLMDPEGARAFVSCGPAEDVQPFWTLRLWRSRATSMLAASRTALLGPSGRKPGPIHMEVVSHRRVASFLSSECLL